MDRRHKTIQTMTPNTTIEEQARREAREAWMNNSKSIDMYTAPEDWKAGYAAALISERSKPQPSVEEVMEVVKEEVSHEPDRWRVLSRLTKLLNR